MSGRIEKVEGDGNGGMSGWEGISEGEVAEGILSREGMTNDGGWVVC